MLGGGFFIVLVSGVTRGFRGDSFDTLFGSGESVVVLVSPILSVHVAGLVLPFLHPFAIRLFTLPCFNSEI